MNIRYQAYNELTFEAYCKTSIDRAILKGRMERAKRAALEVPLSDLTEADLYRLYVQSQETPIYVSEQITFTVQGINIPVRDAQLGRALSFLLPKYRDVVLLHYFMDMSDPQIASLLHISKSAVQRRRTAALERLKGACA